MEHIRIVFFLLVAARMEKESIRNIIGHHVEGASANTPSHEMSPTTPVVAQRSTGYASDETFSADPKHAADDDTTMPPTMTRHDSTSGAMYVLEHNDDTIQLVTGPVWAFFPPMHVRVARWVLIVFWCVVVFATLSALGFPLANKVPPACKEPVENFFYSFSFFGIMTAILLPLWARAFFEHMLESLQQGLQPFSQAYDRELTIALGCGLVGATSSALYGLDVAPPPKLVGDDGPPECAHCQEIVRSSSWSFLLAVGILSLMHVLHYQYLCRARQRYMDSRRVVLY
jgi:hypothetical protein